MKTFLHPNQHQNQHQQKKMRKKIENPQNLPKTFQRIEGDENYEWKNNSGNAEDL